MDTCLWRCHMSRIARKPVLRVSDKVWHKPGCIATEDGWRLEISDLGIRGIVLSMSRKRRRWSPAQSLHSSRGATKDGFSVQFFRFFKSIFFGLLVATCDLVHDVETIFHLPYLLLASGNLFWNMSDARETANCSFTGITHISEKIFRCW